VPLLWLYNREHRLMFLTTPGWNLKDAVLKESLDYLASLVEGLLPQLPLLVIGALRWVIVRADDFVGKFLEAREDVLRSEAQSAAYWLLYYWNIICEVVLIFLDFERRLSSLRKIRYLQGVELLVLMLMMLLVWLENETGIMFCISLCPILSVKRRPLFEEAWLPQRWSSSKL
jgi:hypothetical protein